LRKRINNCSIYQLHWYITNFIYDMRQRMFMNALLSNWGIFLTNGISQCSIMVNINTICYVVLWFNLTTEFQPLKFVLWWLGSNDLCLCASLGCYVIILLTSDNSYIFATDGKALCKSASKTTNSQAINMYSNIWGAMLPDVATIFQN
jgi:hypothetical protein